MRIIQTLEGDQRVNYTFTLDSDAKSVYPHSTVSGCKGISQCAEDVDVTGFQFVNRGWNCVTSPSSVNITEK